MKALLTIRNFYLFGWFCHLENRLLPKTSISHATQTWLDSYRNINHTIGYHSFTHWQLTFPAKRTWKTVLKVLFKTTKNNVTYTPRISPHPLWKLTIDFLECKEAMQVCLTAYCYFAWRKNSNFDINVDLLTMTRLLILHYTVYQRSFNEVHYAVILLTLVT